MQLGLEGSSESTTTSSIVSWRLVWPVRVPRVTEEGEWVRGSCHLSSRSAEEHGLSTCGGRGGWWQRVSQEEWRPAHGRAGVKWHGVCTEATGSPGSRTHEV